MVVYKCCLPIKVQDCKTGFSLGELKIWNKYYFYCLILCSSYGYSWQPSTMFCCVPLLVITVWLFITNATFICWLCYISMKILSPKVGCPFVSEVWLTTKYITLLYSFIIKIQFHNILLVLLPFYDSLIS